MEAVITTSVSGKAVAWLSEDRPVLVDSPGSAISDASKSIPRYRLIVDLDLHSSQHSEVLNLQPL